ncbi:hypothetical protein CPU12_13460 [Malaciobacter molluscorum LMG 25693]|uniref:Uncharacterized protein n=1 Tax=Malaciobacter molluscorum LMG 25693 TaxID=870501 RepID=A0A2G1DEE3_9BACT|nr:hypothetical protein [Malaciobacter molluscorum]AXX93063.1 hypothetical protein AMOL_2110 [Malaciobacter molluscorum LMG 25693]PHO16863.1 hypothetical protein CPU12_13460 [Malaciobacter molluscorum LMG 25693]
MFTTKQEVITNIEKNKALLQQIKYKKTQKFSKPLLDMLNKFHIILQNEDKNVQEIISKYNQWYKQLEINIQIDRIKVYEKMQEMK